MRENAQLKAEVAELRVGSPGVLLGVEWGHLASTRAQPSGGQPRHSRLQRAFAEG